MRDLVLFAIAGFAASFVDGALGMGFGPTSSSILLISGLAPAAVSTSVNIAKVVTGLAAGVSHWQFRNLNKTLVLNLAAPGCLGALVGVTVLSNIDGPTLRPYLAILLTLVGLRILVRFASMTSQKVSNSAALDESGVRAVARDTRGLKIAALLGGITNGLIGAWGPVVTPYLLHRGVQPRYAIGCVNTAEIAVASASAFSLLASIGTSGLDVSLVIAMLLGGVIAAPLAAWVVRYVPARPLGIAVAALLLLTNARELIAFAGLASSAWVPLIYVALLALLIVAVVAGPSTVGRVNAAVLSSRARA
jgi:uncharacterized membrane protein YfcA